MDNIDSQDEELNLINSLLHTIIIQDNEDNIILPFFKNSNNLMIIPVVINKITYHFLLDTGAQCSCIIRSIYERVDQKNMNYITVSMGSSTGVKEDMDIFTLPKLKFGNTTIKNNSFCILKDEVLKLPTTDNNDMQLFGIIGWDILKYLNLELNNESIKFVNNNKVDNKFSKNLISTSYPVILLTDESGIEYAFGFDSGAKKSCLRTDSKITTNNKLLRTEEIDTYGVNGLAITQEKIYGNIKLIINDKKIIFETINTGYCDYYKGFKLDGILGVDILQHQNLKLYGSSNQFII